MSSEALLRRLCATFLAEWTAASRPLGERRFARVGPRLLACLQDLYGHTEGFDPWLHALVAQIGRRGSQRPDDLQILDRDREAHPRWFHERRLIGYAAYADRFGGTLRGVIERIDHLRSLGVGYLHLLPFLRAREGDNDGGFAVAAFDQVEPRLGDMDDLRDLTAALRKAGISLCSDFVLNHVADDHPWAKAARAGDPRYRRWFHVFEDRSGADAYEASLGQVFPETVPGNFSHVADMDAWVWTTFYPYQWDLNYAEPEVFAAMADTLLMLANQGVEVFRLDSAPYIWKRLGTACVNEPEVHQVLGAFRAICELAAPATLLKAEAITSTHELVPYFGRGPLHGHECHLAYQSSLMAAAWASLGEGSATLVGKLLASMPDVPAMTGWLTYVRCHDEIVWGVLRSDLESIGEDYPRHIAAVASTLEGHEPHSFGRGAPFQYTRGQLPHGTNGMAASLLGLPDDPRMPASSEAVARLALMYGLAFWMGCVPMIYMGDELGQPTNADPDDAQRIAGDGRWLQRPRLDAARLAMAHAGEGVPATTLALFGHLREARGRLPGPGADAVRVVDGGSPAVLALARGGRERAWFNFSGNAVRIDEVDPTWETPHHGLREDGMLPPWGMHWSVAPA